ncbi:dTDP-4-dehydrorhamnose 3,5-epimerase family protein [Oerskovia sp. KBS0722]|uniref:dTDP-4-dehydrorhamnose 3,5-epimerase family protein n=1 Tax=Oerskovia sp. KBS0722 TaxID=1179673 RepID=UPI00110EAB0B|nr:dTDP-4-dehydrorhamnose 3,5-epimerase [Oerskovia sp. KBS0722]QDW64151.1 dTDP-4-keto-6-deoxy-D-glucose epimerase [Oerskovia sp. KBS0722]
MQVRELKVAGAWEITPKQFGDDRGVFLEWFKAETFTALTGHPLDLQQANMSVSAAGVLRGIHFADVPPGQAKYVTCPRGAVLDVVVDVRVGSPTFGQWDTVLLDDVDRRAIYLSEGLGHAFCSLEDGSTVTYLCSTGYAPGREHGIHPLDPAVGIEWPTLARDGSALTFELSAKDLAAPSLEEAAALGILPTFEASLAYLPPSQA